MIYIPIIETLGVNKYAYEPIFNLFRFKQAQ